MSPERENAARALDARILAAIDAWVSEGRILDDRAFERLALDLFVHQARYNEPYAAYAASLGFDPQRPPATWRDIPAVPTLAFKDSVLTAFDASKAVLTFETSGTTQAQSGRHHFETAALYDAALLAGFDRFVLSDRDGKPMRYLLFVPERATSSLGYMMRRVAAERGDGAHAWYLDPDGDGIDVDRFVADARAAHAAGIPVCIAGTAFAFVALTDELGRRGIVLETAAGSRIMETGGFKGRTRVVERTELYAALSRCLCVPQDRIIAEYGMTELTSQYYDAPWSRGAAERVKSSPPWLRAVVIGGDGREVEPGDVGSLRHVDLANRGSAIAIDTEDLALRLPDEGFVLLGRDPEARLRGCSLDAEDLIAGRP